MRRFGVVLLAVVLIFTYVPSASAGVAKDHKVATIQRRLERQMFRLINRFRRAHDRKALDMVGRINKFAERHSRKMARQDRIFHSDLSFWKPSDWTMAGENVGAGGSVASLFDAFLHSRPHRKNILRRIFRLVGIGVYVDDSDVVWVTTDFVG